MRQDNLRQCFGRTRILRDCPGNVMYLIYNNFFNTMDRFIRLLNICSLAVDE